MNYDPHSNPFQARSDSNPFGPPLEPAGHDAQAWILAVFSLVTGVMGLLAFPGTCILFLPLPLISLATGTPVLLMRSSQSPKTVAIVGLAFAGLSVIAIIAAIVLRATGVIKLP